MYGQKDNGSSAMAPERLTDSGKIRLLVISRTPWDDAISFGNTFSNLFGGMTNVKVFCICCQHGCVNNRITADAFQMTDKQVLASIVRPQVAVGERVPNQSTSVENTGVKEALGGKWYTRITARRTTLALMARDIIWRLGRWKKSTALGEFLDEAKPDLVYLPIYASWYMCHVQSCLLKKLGIPAIGHISDDVYGFPKDCAVSPLLWLYRAVLRKKLRGLIAHCAYLEVFAQNMQRAYSALFDKPCFLIGKGVSPDTIRRGEGLDLTKDTWSFVYTGNIGNGRWQVLCRIAQALSRLSDSNNAVLNVYSASAITTQVQKKFAACTSLHFMGALDADKVAAVQQAADVLVHVESFSPKSVFETRMSLSTKIIDYLCTGRPVFAAGPRAVNSIEFLESNGLAVVAGSEAEIEGRLLDMLRGEIDCKTMADGVYRYLQNERNIGRIQEGIRKRMQELMDAHREAAV